MRPFAIRPLNAISSADLVEILIPASARRPRSASMPSPRPSSIRRCPARAGRCHPVTTNRAPQASRAWAGRPVRVGRTSPCRRSDWKRAPELLIELESRPELIARVMIFILATASRCGAARMAKRRNIDLKAKTWTVPVEDLKDAKHRKRALVVAAQRRCLIRHSARCAANMSFTDDRGKPFTDQNITHFVRKLRPQEPGLDRRRNRSSIYCPRHARDVPQLVCRDQAGPRPDRD